ncbi:MAG: hypothetical protein LBR38_07455 [Synergistaceae bacterium]|jgi:hypothetical protein|nr:hypothetical protein [Synergistaceae bacterium]
MLKANGLINFIGSQIRSGKPDADKIYAELMKFAERTDAKEFINLAAKCHAAKLINTSALTIGVIDEMLNRTRSSEKDSSSRAYLISLYESSDESDPLRWAYCMGRALLYFADFDVEAGEPLFRHAMRLCFEFQQKFPWAKAPNFTAHLCCVYLLDNVSRPSPRRFPKPQLEVIKRSARHVPFTVCTLCDSAYFRAYGGRFLSSLREQCADAGIFLLLVNPDPDVLAAASSYDDVTSAAIRYDGQWPMEFCISARFILASEVLRLTGGPTIFTESCPKLAGSWAGCTCPMSRRKLCLWRSGKSHGRTNTRTLPALTPMTGQALCFVTRLCDIMAYGWLMPLSFEYRRGLSS